MCYNETLSAVWLNQGPAVMSNLVPHGRFLLNWTGKDVYRTEISCMCVSVKPSYS